jgi:crossover junction endodeoxyribonuclease RuvC
MTAMAPVRVLGIDPGSWATGWGVVDGIAHRPSLVACGVIRVSGPMADRLARVRESLSAVVAEQRPTCCAVEAPFHGANPRSALQLAHARGVVLEVLATSGLAVLEYTPATVKKAVTGTGRADKRQVQLMVQRLLHGAAAGPHDASDALAVALCHLASAPFQAAVARASIARAR